MSRPRLRALHTSDVHLGATDASRGDRPDPQRASFERVIDLGREHRVDFLLIAGDFFDNARVRQDTLEFAAHEIARLERPTVIGPGNHDHVGPGSVYDRWDLTSVAQNLTILRGQDGETVAVDGLEVEVWGKAHTEMLPTFFPFEGAPPRGDAPWQIGIGHGHFIHPEALLHHSFHILDDHLAAAGRDYVALGHWERMTRVAAGEGGVAAYSGAPEGLSGHTGGYAMLVDFMEDGEVRLTALPLEEGRPPVPHDALPLLRGL